MVSEHSEDRKLAELGDLVDWLWDVRQHDSYLETGWFYLAMFRVLGSRFITGEGSLASAVFAL